MRIVKKIKLENLCFELNLIPQNLQESVDVVLQLPRMLELARLFCPVQTGSLRDTIRVDRPSSTSAKLVAGDEMVDYAAHVHEGTTTQPAQPFLLQALIAERSNVSRDILREAVNRL